MKPRRTPCALTNSGQAKMFVPTLWNMRIFFFHMTCTLIDHTFTNVAIVGLETILQCTIHLTHNSQFTISQFTRQRG